MIFVISSVAIAIAGVWGVNKFNSRELANNELFLENVEALTQGDIPQGPPLTNWKKYEYKCPLKIETKTEFVGVISEAQIPNGKTPIIVKGQLGYNKTITTTTTPIVTKCGNGTGSCLFDADC